jgi:iron(III) transport system substrate-binding protein
MRLMWAFAAIATAGAALSGCGGGDETPKAAAGELNIYSSRHYEADQQIYDAFAKETGITVNRIEAKGDELLERLKREGAASPADVVITVDAGNLWRMQEAGVLQPIESAVLNERVPANLRDPEGRWFGVAKRARVIVYNPEKIALAPEFGYAELADPKLKGLVCSRPSSNIYNLSLMAGLIETLGPAKAEAWAKGVVANFARPPEGNDTDQLTATAAGVCGVALVNHYYLARLAQSEKPEDKAAAAKLRVIFPDQQAGGAHVNITGAGVAAHAPDKANAIRFIEFLTSPAAQTLFAKGNNEYPVVVGAPLENPALESYGAFKESQVPLAVYGQRQAEAQTVFDRAGWR